MNQSDILQVQLNLDDKDKFIQQKLEAINNLIEVQRNCIKNEDDRYMIGLYNGMVLIRSVLTDKEPLFYEEENRFNEMEGMNNG